MSKSSTLLAKQSLQSYRSQKMQIKLKSSALATVFLTLLSSTSIPAVMSAPISDRVNRRGPVPPVETDRNRDGAQVRVLFNLRNDEKLICSDVIVEVAVRDNTIAAPTGGGLVGDYNIVTKHTQRLSPSTVKDTCVYNFSLFQRDIGVGRIADITISGNYPGGYYVRDNRKQQKPFIIKSANQVFRIDGMMQPPPN
jgi:hypothetical protein